MFAVTRLRIREEDAAAAASEVADLLAALGRRPGFLHGELGRAADDPGLWALLTRWDGVGSYRRALSAAEVKIAGAPVWVHALDEPGVYLDEGPRPFAEGRGEGWGDGRGEASGTAPPVGPRRPLP